ncbi:AraC-like DNA-binding protein [Paraburkholderia bannensis]|uniref:AraC-like DNA-binding protein n=1 Tax=Paraburkholderia bannensis TaxID=765414 RepID=A0A7W9U4M7_9BURK|nr:MULTISPECIES: hypothetical protein [Paraburkholderia]MBB3261154.1 AraC-like DNA-binding protein [Paraburkholderia sp. WP4_3_2]MBB6106191.1 AraC-like DNA-binding protein [Paraburkholderia bannensis]
MSLCERKSRDNRGLSLAHFQEVRVERPQSLLHGSGFDIEAIATKTGYVDGATLRTLSRQRLGCGICGRICLKTSAILPMELVNKALS